MTAPVEDNFLSPKFDPEIKKWIPKITSYMMPTRETCKMSCAIIKNPESSPRGRRVVIKAMSKGVDFEMLRSKLYQYCMETLQ